MIGMFALIGLISGLLKNAKGRNPFLRIVILDPNLPAVFVCLNEGSLLEEWYAITAEHLEERPHIPPPAAI